MLEELGRNPRPERKRPLAPRRLRRVLSATDDRLRHADTRPCGIGEKDVSPAESEKFAATKPERGDRAEDDTRLFPPASLDVVDRLDDELAERRLDASELDGRKDRPVVPWRRRTLDELDHVL